MPTVKERVKEFIIKSNNPYLDKSWLMNVFDTNERVIRDTLSELREKGDYYYYALGKGKYKRLTERDWQKAERYMQKIIKSLSTIYFRTLLPLRRYIKDQKMREQIEQLALIFDEPGEGK